MDTDRSVIVPISKVKLWDKNPRGCTKSDFARLKKQIQKFGVYKPLIACRENGALTVLGGNMRLRALRELGHKEVWISVVKPKNEAEKIEISLSDNDRVGYYEDQALAELVYPYREEIDLEAFKVDIPVPDVNLSDILSRFSPEPEKDLDAIPEEVEPICKRGQIWQLGRHRLMCGDSTSPKDTKKLLGRTRVPLGITSPPYAVGKEYEVDVSFEQHIALLRAVADRTLEVVLPGGFFFLNFGEIASQAHAGPLTQSDRQCIYPISRDYWEIFHIERGMDLYAARVWYKPFNRLQQPFWTYKTSIPHHQEWECLWTWRLPGGNGDVRHDWDISVHAVWDTREETTEDKPLTRHVAAFPICLPLRALKAHSEMGDSVWDPFLGSGTTLIACEHLNRICYGMEIEPKYCDVTIARWEELTGKKAKLVKDGKRSKARK